MTAQRAVVVASIGWAVAASLTAVTIAIWLTGTEPEPGLMDYGNAGVAGVTLPQMSFASMGALLAIRRPGNRIGWLLLFAGLGLAVSALAAMVAVTGARGGPGQRDVAAFAAWATFAGFSASGVTMLTGGFLFPNGRPQSTLWARAVKVQLVIWAVLYGFALVRPGSLVLFDAIANPFGVGPDLSIAVGTRSVPLVLVWHVVMGGIVSVALVARYRDSGPLERAQLRWVIVAVTVTTIIGLLPIAESLVRLAQGRATSFTYAIGPFGIAAASVPVAVAIAVLRYRLYDIDRLISRTIAYAAISATLLALYAGSILLLQAPLGSLTNGEGLAVAISTLVVATLFQPLRHRIQRAVDRRFHRARYDAERTTAAFADRLRDEIDLPTLATELDATVRTAIQPSSLALWLRERR